MIVRVSYQVEVSDQFRRAIKHYTDLIEDKKSNELANRNEIELWYKSHGTGFDEFLINEHEECCFKEFNEIQHK